MSTASVQMRRDLAKRARFIAGQANAIAVMSQAGRSEEDLLMQLLAIRAAAQSATQVVARSRLSAELKRQLRRKLKDCPGVCDYCDEVIALLDEIDLDRTIKAIRLVS